MSDFLTKGRHAVRGKNQHMNVQKQILNIAQKQTGAIILRRELSALGSASQINRALNALQARQLLVRIGTGVYAKTRHSVVTGAVIPAGSLETLALEALQKLGIAVAPGEAAARYAAGLTRGIPGVFVVNTGRRRISRKITVGGRTLQYVNTGSASPRISPGKSPEISGLQ